jgi:hypothetical protein
VANDLRGRAERQAAKDPEHRNHFPLPEFAPTLARIARHLNDRIKSVRRDYRAARKEFSSYRTKYSPLTFKELKGKLTSLRTDIEHTLHSGLFYDDSLALTMRFADVMDRRNLFRRTLTSSEIENQIGHPSNPLFIPTFRSLGVRTLTRTWGEPDVSLVGLSARSVIRFDQVTGSPLDYLEHDFRHAEGKLEPEIYRYGGFTSARKERLSATLQRLTKRIDSKPGISDQQREAMWHVLFTIMHETAVPAVRARLLRSIDANEDFIIKRAKQVSAYSTKLTDKRRDDAFWSKATAALRAEIAKLPNQ